MDDLTLVGEFELGRKVTATAARCRAGGMWLLDGHAGLLAAEVYGLTRQNFDYSLLSLFGCFGVRVLSCQMMRLLLLYGWGALGVRLSLELELPVGEVGQDLFGQRLIHGCAGALFGNIHDGRTLLKQVRHSEIWGACLRHWDVQWAAAALCCNFLHPCSALALLK